MDDIASLRLAVDSRDVKTAKRDLDSFTNSASKSGIVTDKMSKNFRNNSAAADGFANSLRRLVGPLAAFLSVRQIGKAADEWTTLNNRLKLVTDSTKELVDAQNDVFQVSQTGRVALAETAGLYQAIARNQKELKVSSIGVVAVVDTINKTLAIGGGSAQGNAVIQRATVADLRSLADHHSHAVIDENALPYICSRMNLNTGEPAAQMGNQACKPLESGLP